MNFIRVEDVIPPADYSKIINEDREKVIALKKKRRITTENFSFLFENMETVLNQVNEMMFVENVTDPSETKHLVETYNTLLPQENFLSVSMFIEISDEKELLKSMPLLSGIEKSVYLIFGNHEIKATPEEGRSTETLESTLQYLRIYFTKEDADLFKKSKNAFLSTKHKNYSETALISGSLLEELKSEIY
jgi:hypothetical protein